MTAYYNENDPKAAAWLRELIKDGQIPRGIVDERDILDVLPSDLEGFLQCHFFAGIAGWAYAFKLAGWPDDEPVWTGSCPCQPFSAAGKGGGFTDERHLWPAFYYLIAECRPAIIFGEQVASKDGLTWFDLVHADLEGAGYAVGAADLCAAGVGAPHIRQRLYFVADSGGERLQGLGLRLQPGQPRFDLLEARRRGEARPLADDDDERFEWGTLRGCWEGELAHADGRNSGAQREQRGGQYRFIPQDSWADCEWLPCTDGKARPVEPSTQRMADGISESLGPVLPSDFEDFTKEINASSSQAYLGEAVRHLWETLFADVQRERTPRRLDGVHEAPILLAFMRQLADQGWVVAQGISCTGAQAAQEPLRVLRRSDETSRPSSERGLAGQLPGELADTVRILSSVLARYAQKAWGDTFTANASACFPLAHGVKDRVGKLRGYGNAIVPQVAAAFIEPVMEYLGIKKNAAS